MGRTLSRSKTAKKNRAKKREIYAAVELERLKKTLKNLPKTNLSDVATVLDSPTFKMSMQQPGSEPENESDHDEIPEVAKAEIQCSDIQNKVRVVSSSGKEKFFDKRTLMDQHGAFPEWISNRLKNKMLKKQRNVKKKVGKRKQGSTNDRNQTKRKQRRKN